MSNSVPGTVDWLPRSTRCCFRVAAQQRAVPVLGLRRQRRRNRRHRLTQGQQCAGKMWVCQHTLAASADAGQPEYVRQGWLSFGKECFVTCHIMKRSGIGGLRIELGTHREDLPSVAPATLTTCDPGSWPAGVVKVSTDQPKHAGAMQWLPAGALAGIAPDLVAGQWRRRHAGCQAAAEHACRCWKGQCRPPLRRVQGPAASVAVIAAADGGICSGFWASQTAIPR